MSTDIQTQTHLATATDIADGPGAARRPAFRLLRYFSIASLVAIVLATAALTTLQQRLAVRDLIQAQENHHVVLTQSVARGHWPEFAGLFSSAAKLDVAALQQHPEVPRLQQLISREFEGTHVLKVKIYDPAGRTVFSTEQKQIGEDKSGNAGFLSARAGVAASELTHRNQFSAFEQTVENVDVVSSYVPVYKQGLREVEAVFEIYSDISPLLQQVYETRNAVVLQVTAVLLGLYLALFFIVRRADMVIKAQELRRRQDEASLREARQELIRSEQFHRALIEHSSDAVVLLDTDLKVKYATPADVRVLGLPEASLIGLSLTAYACEEYREAVTGWQDQIIAHPEVTHRIEFEGNHTASGRRYFMATGTNLRGHPAVRGIVVNIRDVTTRKLAELELRRHAMYDGLTGLARRDFFVQRMRKAIAHAARQQETLAVMFLDLDGFKKVNDTLGHKAGDLLLQEVAARLRGTLRQDDTIGRGWTADGDGRLGRFGGDEFTILLTTLNQPESAGLVARRMIDAVGAPYVLDGKEVTVTASIGIAMYPQDDSSAEELLKKADTAMYAAKKQGSTFKFHSEL